MLCRIVAIEALPLLINSVLKNDDYALTMIIHYNYTLYLMYSSQ